MSEITREEWKRRYAARIVERSDMNQEEANDAAEAGAEAYEQNERAAGNAIVWVGTPGHWESPETHADEEMSYWDNDEA